MKTIPFNKPHVSGKELYYIAQAVTMGNLGADGFFTKKCSSFIESRFSVKRALMTPSCTAALEMAALLLDIGPGDEVILPSYTFVSTANAFTNLGAKPVFIDIRPDTLNIDETKIESKITKRTKAVVPVHYAGAACEMSPIVELARRHRFAVVEDAAQAIGASYSDMALGAIGDFGCYSFHETKNIICGEGGALLINNPEFVDRAEIIRDKGTNRSKFLKGLVDKYTWVDKGSSYVPSEMNCAYLYAQLENLDAIQNKRKNIFEYYSANLKNLQASDEIELSVLRRGANAHIFYLLCRSMGERDQLLGYLKSKDIGAVFHYVPLHSAPMGLKFGYKAHDLPVTEDLSARLLRLPLYLDLSREDQDRVIAEVYNFYLSLRKKSGRTYDTSLSGN